MVVSNPHRAGLGRGSGWAAIGLVIAGAAVLGVGFSGPLSARALGRLSRASGGALVAQDRPAIVAGPPAPDLDAPPAGTPLPILRPGSLTPAEAARYNDAIPLARIANPPSRSFRLAGAEVEDRARATDCLTAAVYYEAASEPLQGQRAVAQVVLNRLARPAFPKTVCGVVFQGAERSTGCQFTFTCDGALGREPSARGWAAARAVASAALSGAVEPSVGAATHYHTRWVAPDWSGSLLKVANIGAHIFYDWPGAGRPDLSGAAYAGQEPDAARVWRIGRAPFGQPAAEAIASIPPPAMSPSPGLRVAAVINPPAGPLFRPARIALTVGEPPVLLAHASGQTPIATPSRLPVPKDW